MIHGVIAAQLEARDEVLTELRSPGTIEAQKLTEDGRRADVQGKRAMDVKNENASTTEKG